MNAIIAGGIAERGNSIVVLGAVEHYEFAVLHYYGGIESAGGFEAVALRSEDGCGGKARPRSEGRAKRDDAGIGECGVGQERENAGERCAAEQLLRFSHSEEH